MRREIARSVPMRCPPAAMGGGRGVGGRCFVEREGRSGGPEGMQVVDSRAHTHIYTHAAAVAITCARRRPPRLLCRTRTHGQTSSASSLSIDKQ